jgi:osmotically-inducible protein OsmY
MNRLIVTRHLLPIAVLCGAAVLVQGCAPAVVVGATTGAAVVHDRRSLGSMVDDAAIELKAKGLLSTDPLLKDQTNIKLTSVNGIVLLSGEAATAELRDHVLAAMREIRGIRRITNEIRIAPPSSLGSRAKDTWITGEVNDPADCWPYGYDNSRRQALPQAVVFVTEADQVAAVVRLCQPPRSR